MGWVSEPWVDCKDEALATDRTAAAEIATSLQLVSPCPREVARAESQGVAVPGGGMSGASLGRPLAPPAPLLASYTWQVMMLVAFSQCLAVYIIAEVLHRRMASLFGMVHTF